MVVYRALTLRHTIRYHCSLVLFAFSFNFVSTLCLNVCFHDQFSCRNKRGDVFVSHNLFFVLILCVSADRFYFIVFSHYPAAESACLLFFVNGHLRQACNISVFSRCDCISCRDASRRLFRSFNCLCSMCWLRPSNRDVLNEFELVRSFAHTNWAQQVNLDFADWSVNELREPYKISSSAEGFKPYTPTEKMPFACLELFFKWWNFVMFALSKLFYRFSVTKSFSKKGNLSMRN